MENKQGLLFIIYAIIVMLIVSFAFSAMAIKPSVTITAKYSMFPKYLIGDNYYYIHHIEDDETLWDGQRYLDFPVLYLVGEPYVIISKVPDFTGGTGKSFTPTLTVHTHPLGEVKNITEPIKYSDKAHWICPKCGTAYQEPHTLLTSDPPIDEYYCRKCNIYWQYQRER